MPYKEEKENKPKREKEKENETHECKFMKNNYPKRILNSFQLRARIIVHLEFS